MWKRSSIGLVTNSARNLQRVSPATVVRFNFAVIFDRVDQEQLSPSRQLPGWHLCARPAALLFAVGMLTSVLHALSVAALAVSAAAVTPSRTTRDAYPDVNPVGVVTRSLAMNPLVPALTNAQRLSRGLVPNRPRRAYGARRAQALQPRQSSTPCVIQATGKIAVYGGSALSGYLWRSANAFGEYGSTLDESQALIVNICEASGVHNIYAQVCPLSGCALFSSALTTPVAERICGLPLSRPDQRGREHERQHVPEQLQLRLCRGYSPEYVPCPLLHNLRASLLPRC